MAPLGVRAAVADRYVLGELLGRGGMGEVYDAVDRRLDRPVALKCLRADLVEDEAMRRRVETEARLAARLVHPNVVTVFDSGIDDGHPFIVMERLDGRTLRDDLREGPLPDREVRALAVQVLDALEAAHEIGLIHRDVKPGNVLAASGGTWKVADFGIATSIDEAHSVTRTGELLGSPSYLAPERVEGRPATAASDLYGLGVLLFEALSGVRPFGEGNAIAIAMKIREGIHPPLSEVAPDADPALVDVIERAMSREPADRFASAHEMAAAIGATEPATSADPGADADTAVIARSPDPTAVLEPVGPRLGAVSVPAPASTPASSAPEHPHRAPRRMLAALVGAAVIVVLVVVGIIALTAGDDPTSGSGAPARSAADVPAPLQDALDRLQETIAP